MPYFQLFAPMAETKLSATMVQCQLSTDFFFKILKFSGPSIPSMTSSIPQPHCLSGGFIMTMVIVISFAHERKTAPNEYALN